MDEIGATARDEVRAEGQTLGLPDDEYSVHLMSMLAEQALIGGAIGTVQYLVAEGAYELSSYSCRDAAQGGRKEMIQWLLGQGVSLYSEVSEFAAMNGHLDLLRVRRSAARRTGGAVRRQSRLTHTEPNPVVDRGRALPDQLFRMGSRRR